MIDAEVNDHSYKFFLNSWFESWPLLRIRCSLIRL
jgi:hypothetical protein